MSTYTPIASITLASAASSVTFSGIPQTYTDLVVVVNTGTTSNAGLQMRLNGDTGSNYSTTSLYGTGSTAASGRYTNLTMMYTGNIVAALPTTLTANAIVHIMNYANTTTNKTVLCRFNDSANDVNATVSLWRNTAAVNEVTLRTPTSTYLSGSTFNLYGINAANSGQAKATGGDSIYRDTSYWYHIFRSSGTFTPKESLSVDYLVVGGGAIGGNGGSSSTGAGGGGGGSSSSTFSALTSISGSNIATITAGGGQVERAGRLGGLGGTGTSGNGGTGGNGAVGSGGGTNGQAGNAFFITGSSITYGGGGGGAGFPGQNQGTGGAGGGGNAGNPAQNGTANTGGGGGGCSADNTNGGNGGSGIIIVRYPV